MAVRSWDRLVPRAALVEADLATAKAMKAAKPTSHSFWPDMLILAPRTEDQRIEGRLWLRRAGGFARTQCQRVHPPSLQADINALDGGPLGGITPVRRVVFVMKTAWCIGTTRAEDRGAYRARVV